MKDEIVIGPRDKQGLTVEVARAFNTEGNDYYDTFITYKFVGVENVSADRPEHPSLPYLRMVNVDFENGHSTSIFGFVESVYYE